MLKNVIHHLCPMVEAGCEKYDEKFKVAGVYEEVYTKELKEKVCRRIAEKHLQHIEDGAYDPRRHNETDGGCIPKPSFCPW